MAGANEPVERRKTPTAAESMALLAAKMGMMENNITLLTQNMGKIVELEIHRQNTKEELAYFVQKHNDLEKIVLGEEGLGGKVKVLETKSDGFTWAMRLVSSAIVVQVIGLLFLAVKG